MIWGSDRIKEVKVVDGDTIKVVFDLGFSVTCKQTLRLSRINTPERGKPGYKEAALYLESRVAGDKIKIVTYKQGKYGRYLCDVFSDGVNVNNELIEKGLAVAYGGKRRQTKKGK